MFTKKENCICKYKTINTGDQIAEEETFYGYLKPSDYVSQPYELVQTINIDGVDYEVVTSNPNYVPPQ